MKLHYDPATDMLHISFGERSEVEGFDLCDGIVVHLDAEGDVAALEVERASERVSLEELEDVAQGRLPVGKTDLRELLLAPEPRTESLTPPRDRERSKGR